MLIVLQRKRQAAEHVEQLLQDGEDLLQGGGNRWQSRIDRIDRARQLLQYRFSFIEQKFILSIHHIRVEKKWYRQVLRKTEKGECRRAGGSILQQTAYTALDRIHQVVGIFTKKTGRNMARFFPS
ncbi:hypothetical protein B4113_1037 [Geobacillus sp. B4113_201601]|nr:hypothetical protein B4113_1037 [Geobacillus sp. B4113_201601]